MTDDTNEHRAVARSVERTDHPIDGIRQRARQKLQAEGLEVGVRTLMELAADKKQKGSTRGAAAKALVQLSGIQNAAAMSPEDLTELSPVQIQALLAEAERALAARLDKLKTIDHEPTTPAERGSIFD